LKNENRRDVFTVERRGRKSLAGQIVAVVL
jgi:hypothetical protein